MMTRVTVPGQYTLAITFFVLSVGMFVFLVRKGITSLMRGEEDE